MLLQIIAGLRSHHCGANFFLIIVTVLRSYSRINALYLSFRVAGGISVGMGMYSKLLLVMAHCAFQPDLF
jgi:hypothetical protein